jgi:bacterioferritin-associated ferredoxin
MSEAAMKLGVSNDQIRRLIKQGILAADQVVRDAPYQNPSQRSAG